MKEDKTIMSISKLRVNANILKVIAIFLMLIDHIGYYYSFAFTPETYYILRSIGRISMPIFLYLLIQGFFYTKNLKAYVLRLLLIAITTLIIEIALTRINNIFFNKYYDKSGIYISVVFSYALSLILIYMIENNNLIKKANFAINLIIRIFVITIVILLFYFLKIEYGVMVPFMAIGLYIIEKLFMDNKKHLLFKRKFKDIYTFKQLKTLYIILIGLLLFTSIFLLQIEIGFKYALILAIIPIALYNGEKGTDNKLIKRLFYIIYPLQTFIFYLSSILIGYYFF